MKKVLLATLLLSGVMGIAQERMHRQAMEDLSAEQIATLHTKKMTLALDLNEEQQAQVQTIHLENARLKKVRMEERKAKRENEEADKPTPEERYAMQTERLDHMIAQKAKMKDILSEEQYARWEKLQLQKGKHHRGKGKKGPHGKHSDRRR